MKETKAGKQRMRKRLIELALQEAQRIREEENMHGWAWSEMNTFRPRNPIMKMFPHKVVPVVFKRERKDGTLTKGRVGRRVMTHWDRWHGFKIKWRSIGIDVSKRGIPLVEKEEGVV